MNEKNEVKNDRKKDPMEERRKEEQMDEWKMRWKSDERKSKVWGKENRQREKENWRRLFIVHVGCVWEQLTKRIRSNSDRRWKVMSSIMLRIDPRKIEWVQTKKDVE